ncbi:MAG: response regulator transcription factor [Pedobacter sp.]|nr:MAG: response regulator transcription factor [Pedobacter sp.]
MDTDSNSQLLVLKFDKQELKLLELIADGLTNEQIADRIFKGKRTVEGMRKMLLSKTSSKNTAALMAFAFRTRLLI